MLLRSLRQFTSYRSYDRAEFAWGLVVAVFAIAVAATRPQAFVAHAIVVVVAVFVTVLAVPNRFANQLIVALTYSAGETLVIAPGLWNSRPRGAVTLLLSMWLANTIAVACAWQLHAWRRREFVAREAEQKAQEEAKRQLAERQRAEEALQQSREKVSLALRSAGMGAWQLDLRDGRRDFDEQVCRCLGIDPSRFAGTAEEFYAAVHPEDRDRLHAALARTIASGAMYEIEYRVVWPDGSVHHIAARGQLACDAAGQPQRIDGLVWDITQRKQAEEALRASEARFRSLVTGSGPIIFRGAADGSILDAPGWEAVTGQPREAYQGLGWFERVHPEDLGPMTAHWSACLARGEPAHIDYRILTRDGQWRWVHGYGVPVRADDGQTIEWVGTVTDIHDGHVAQEALRQSEERFKLSMEATNDGLWDWNVQTNEAYFSPGYFRMLGYEPNGFPGTGESWKERIHPDDRGHVWQAKLACIEGRSDFFEVEFRMQARDGGWRWILGRGKCVARDGQGRALRLVGTHVDITERKRAEQELKAAKLGAEQARTAAESASRAKDQFIAVLSHELRTPLTPAVAALSLMRRDVRLPGDVRDDLEMVNRNIELEVRLIADLLDVSRIISGKLHLEKRPVDVALAIREAAGVVSGDLDAKGQTLAIQTSGAPYLTFADAARLQQVFWNLLRNSIKFSPARSTIAIRARALPVDHCPLASQPCPLGRGDCPLPQAGNGNGQPCGGNLVVEVIDQGSGIAPDMLPRLFNAFEQEQKARSFGGLGLGLSICKAVIEAHGGSIAAQSQGVGCGATFTVRLPVAQCPLSPAGTQPQDDPGVGAGGSPQDGRCPLRVLLVEDHVDTARLMTRLLRAEGHDVATAGSVAEGLLAVRQKEPDALISDLGLPDGSGLDLMRQLLAQGHRIPAIALSGYGAPADIEMSRAAGFAEHLVKPLNSIELLTAALARLGVRRASPPDGSH